MPTSGRDMTPNEQADYYMNLYEKDGRDVLILLDVFLDHHLTEEKYRGH